MTVQQFVAELLASDAVAAWSVVGVAGLGVASLPWRASEVRQVTGAFGATAALLRAGLRRASGRSARPMFSAVVAR